MLVGEVQRGAGHRQRKHGRGQGHPCPLRAFVLEQDPGDVPASEDHQEDGDELKQEFRPGDGNMGEMNESSYPFIEERRLQLEPEELCVMRVQSWIQVALHPSQIHAIVLSARVVTHRGYSQQREPKDQEDIANARKTNGYYSIKSWLV